MTKKNFNKEKIVKTTSDITGKAIDTVELVADKTEDILDTAKEKVEEFMNKPEVIETKEDIEDVAENAVEAVKTAVKAVRTKVFDIVLQYEGDFVIADIEKAVKKDAASKKIKGDIKIYINVAEKTAYYTVNGEGNEAMKVPFA